MTTADRPPYPLRTGRLLLRLMSAADRVAFTAYRNDPEIARFQCWEVPFPYAASDYLDGQDAMLDLAADGWTTLAIERLDQPGVLLGDVCCRIDSGANEAEIGYTLTREGQGHGFATEAAAALVADLFDRVGVSRVSAELDPRNGASARVLERVGLLPGSISRQSYLCRGQWQDSAAYALTAAQWRVLRGRG